MKCRLNGVVMLIAGVSLALGACSSDNGGGGDGDASAGGSSGSGGSGTGGKATGGTSSSTGGAKSSGGTSSTGGAKSSGGTSGTGGASTGGTGTGGKKPMTDAGPDANTPDASGDAGDPALIARGSYLVNSVALCGGCHTDRTKPTAILGGNATFSTGLPAPNLTSDATGLGSWSNQQIKDAFRNGVDSDGKPLSPIMPYQLFHNMSDADADAIVAYLRSLTHVNNDVGERTVTVNAAGTPFALADFPPAHHSDPDSGAEFAEAEAGFYLVTSVAQCVKCHTPSNAGVLDLTKAFTGGKPNANATPPNLYAPNITPDATGIAGWTADDVVTLLKTATPKGGGKICGMSNYSGLTDADAHAIGVYLTTLPPVMNAAADPAHEPACP